MAEILCSTSDYLRLRELREELGLSLAEIHRRTGVPYRTMQDWFSGKYKTSSLCGLLLLWMETQVELRKLQTEIATLKTITHRF